jgi:TRAP transporter 4TM/12TM fusion protein
VAGTNSYSIIGNSFRWMMGADMPGARPLTGKTSRIFSVIAATFSLFYLYSAIAIVPFFIFLSIYLLFTAVLIFILYPARAKSPRMRVTWVDLIFIGLSVATIAYYIYNFEAMEERMGYVTTPDLIFGLICILIALESCRRVLGPMLPTLGLLFMLYCYLGPYMPGELQHKGFWVSRIVSYCYSESGIFGVVTRVYATYVLLFIIYGAFLQKSKVGDFFIDLAFSLVGRTTGGAAKASVLSSGMVGTVLGSGAANIVITGSFTIPLMKRGGYRPAFASATEAVASLGGMLMPPVMGAAAFVLSSFTDTPYLTVCVVSVVPAILYYTSLYFAVHFEASKMGIRGLPKEELPNFWKTLKRGWHLLIPLIVLVVLLVVRYSPYLAAFWSIIACLGVASLKKETRLYPRDIWDALVMGARNSLIVGCTAGVMGVILSGVLLPGLALKFSSLVLSYSYGLLPMAIIMVMLASYVLGMGMTVTASYIVLSILAAPALIEFGLPVLTAHLIILWYSQDATITPPFCLSAFIAAGIGGADPMRTGFISLRLAKALYIIPFLFVYTPLLMDSGTWPEIIATWISCAIGLVCATAVLELYVFRRTTLIETILLGVAAVIFFIPSYFYDLLGLAIFGSVLFMQRDSWRVPALVRRIVEGRSDPPQPPH